MDERRARIHDDLRGALEGELLFEPIQRAAYAQDASIYQIDPLGVVVPRSEHDVVTAVRYAAENRIAIHPRGAGTDVAGGALGPGLVVDFSRYFRRIVTLASDRVVVQPGVVLDSLNAELAPFGRRIGPDPTGSETCTVGGMIGIDAAGGRSLRYGTMGDHVERLRVVFANGEAADLGYTPWPAYDDEPVDFTGVVVRKLGAVVRRSGEVVLRKSPRAPRNRAGYALGKAATATGIDLSRLVVGSEGTLALVTEATLRTVPIPAAQAVLLMSFARIGDAAEAVVDCLAESPSSCDLYDWRTISLARDAIPAFRERIPEAAEAVLIVEFEGNDPAEVAGHARRLTEKVGRSRPLVDEIVEVTRRAECELILRLRRAVEPLLMRMKGPARPIPFIEDVAVPPEALPEFLQRLQTIFKHHDVSWTLDAHAGHGQLHTRPFLNLADATDVAKLEPLASQVYDAVLDLGGSISGAHGCGLLRTQFLRRQFGELIPAFREIKDAFDPLNVLNPGKVIGDDPHLMIHDLRRSPVAAAEGPPQEEGGNPPILPVLRWPGRSPLETASMCNGCGTCRSNEPSLRMCPSYRVLRGEMATPRAKAGVVRQLMAGTVDPRLWGTEELRQNADLCVHCNLCTKECPSGLDVSSLMLEAKAAYVENHGLAPVDWVLSRVEVWSRLASRFPIVSNALLAGRASRWLLERVFGLSRLRRLPKVHRTPFVRRAGRLGLGRPRPQQPGPRVLYFVDVYANYFDQELAEAVVAVLHQAGVNVYVPQAQKGAGMPALVAGDLDRARDLALANLRILGNAVRDGYTVVCSEPTATLMLRNEYLKLTDDLDAALVAENTRDIGQYLAGLNARGLCPEPRHPLRARVGYHQPCHLRALDVGTPGLDLIRSVPELDVEFIDRGCSGMAGTYGLARDHFRTSLRAGRRLLCRLRDDDIDLGATECSACRMQMEQGTTKRTLHPIKLLSLSYGLNPSLLRHFKEPKPRHLIS